MTLSGPCGITVCYDYLLFSTQELTLEALSDTLKLLEKHQQTRACVECSSTEDGTTRSEAPKVAN